MHRGKREAWPAFPSAWWLDTQLRAVSPLLGYFQWVVTLFLPCSEPLSDSPLPSWWKLNPHCQPPNNVVACVLLSSESCPIDLLYNGHLSLAGFPSASFLVLLSFLESFALSSNPMHSSRPSQMAIAHVSREGIWVFWCPILKYSY